MTDCWLWNIFGVEYKDFHRWTNQNEVFTDGLVAGGAAAASAATV